MDEFLNILNVFLHQEDFNDLIIGNHLTDTLKLFLQGNILVYRFILDDVGVEVGLSLLEFEFI